MRDDFEATFDEQLLAIQAEPSDAAVNVERLPVALGVVPSVEPFCFPYPNPNDCGEDPASILRAQNWDDDSRVRASAMMVDYCDTSATRDAMLTGVDDEAQAGIARILGVLICAEESAINIFHHETARLDAERAVSEQIALREIESEERVHNWLIQQARAYFPQPDDLSAVRRRTRRLFMRVASRDLATHFARITGLDSGVCISLSAILGSAKVKRMRGFPRLLKHIRHDEANHVRKSRDHAVDLGFDTRNFHDCYDLTRTGMVEMLTPIASSFEALEVDPDRLFQRLLRFQGQKDGEGRDIID
ncbi:MAG: hypothetical protein ACT4PZ_06810 [Panacagrimonas sp.]